MKVLLQEWSTDRGMQTSISKDKAQLEETSQELKEAERGGLEGEPMEVIIPDDHTLARMVQNETVFLCDDELEIIDYDA